jgi:hypothetical protein
MPGSWDRRLDKIGDALGGDRREYAPHTVWPVIYQTYWREDVQAVDGGEPKPDELLHAALQATIDQIVEWVVGDARRHKWTKPYHLIVTLHDDQPGRAHFAVPWRPAPDLSSRVLSELLGEGDGCLHWPDCAAHG